MKMMSSMRPFLAGRFVICGWRAEEAPLDRFSEDAERRTHGENQNENLRYHIFNADSVTRPDPRR